MHFTRVFLLGTCLTASIALLLFTPVGLHAQTATTFDDYRRVIQQALALANQANALEPDQRAAFLKNASKILEEIHSVQTPAGALVTVNNSELVTLLRDPTKTDAAVARLTALHDALAQPPAVINPGDLVILADILGRQPFVRAENWYDQILRDLAEFFARLMDNTAAGVFDARDLLVLLAVIAVVVVLVYFLRNLRRSLVAEEELPLPFVEQDARTPGTAFDNAQRFANSGDLRSAVRQLYLATLLLLDQRGRIKYDPTLTNREYLRYASNDPRTTAALQPIVETFDRTWYGFEPITPEEFAAYRRRVEEVRDL